MLAQKGHAFGPELGAIVMGLGMAEVRPMTVVGYLVHPQTPLPTLLLTNIKTWISLLSLLLMGLIYQSAKYELIWELEQSQNISNKTLFKMVIGLFQINFNRHNPFFALFL